MYAHVTLPVTAAVVAKEVLELFQRETRVAGQVGLHLGLWVWMKEVVFDPQPKDLLGAFIKRVSTSSSLRARRDTSPHAAAAAAQGRLRLRQRL